MELAVVSNTQNIQGGVGVEHGTFQSQAPSSAP